MLRFPFQILAHSAGLNAEVWEKLGVMPGMGRGSEQYFRPKPFASQEIAMERFCAAEAVQKTREAGRAWRTLIAFMTDKVGKAKDGDGRDPKPRNSLKQTSRGL